MDTRQRPSRFLAEWKACKRAFMKSPEFNPLSWLYSLVIALASDLADVCGVQWRPIIPWIGISLIVVLALSYACVLRSEVVHPRWCQRINDESSTLERCTWMYLHDGFVSYLVVMLLFFYIKATTTSPGVLLPEKCESTIRSSTRSMYFSLDAVTEQRRLRLYGPLQLEENRTDSNSAPPILVRSKAVARATPSTRYCPSPYASYCKKCDMLRPPRCHHCRVCNRCILQYDHHCVWLNNCIGYNNIRLFILTLVYATLACWYGAMLLYQPFYGPLQERLRHHGGLWNYVKVYMSNELGNEKGLFHVPSLVEIRSSLWSPERRIPVQTVVDLVFPLVFGIGGTLAIFLGTHIKYALLALTTLEYRVKLDRRYELLMSELTLNKTKGTDETWTNPFDQQSYRRNWEQMMGRTWLYHFLPRYVSPQPPFVPTLPQNAK